jgi:Cysteine-rich secretory protein family
MRRMMSKRVGVSTPSKNTRIKNQLRTIDNGHNMNGFTPGVFLNKAPSTTTLISSDSSVSSSSSSSSSGGECDNSSSRSLTSCMNISNSVSPPTSWKSTERKSFILHQPLMVSDPENVDIEMELDPAIALGKVIARSKNLPTTDYFANNHIMVNEERVKRVIAPLSRLRELDELARIHAESMAKDLSLFHSNPNNITEQFQRPFRRLGENVACGTDIRTIHTNMMTQKQHTSDKYNVLHRCYTHMGMATAKGSDGQLYLCQIFRG